MKPIMPIKTAEEWVQASCNLESSDAHNIKQFYKQIQLDAMKEGMRRAIKYIKPLRDGGLFNMRKTILTAAEQLTEKDL